jgi:hypothetical protein
MKKSLLIIILLIGCCFASCSSKRVVTSEKTVIDTVYVQKTVKVRDTTIIVPSASVQIKLPVSELNEKPLFKKSGNARLTLQKTKENVLIARADCDSLQIQLKLKDSLITILHKQLEKEIIREPIQEKTGSWVFIFLRNVGFIILLILALLGLICIIKSYLK